MNILKSGLGDKIAIALSLLCLAHCLLMPLLLIALPALTVLVSADHEFFHLWLLMAVIPISLLAFTTGHNTHRQKGVVIVGAIGLILLVSVAVIGHDVIGELGELILTVFGALIVTLSHLRNFQLTRQTNKLALAQRLAE